MIVANRRAYRDLVSWMKDARPRRVRRVGFALRRFRAAFTGGLGLMGLLSLVDPQAFGQTGPAYSLGWGGWLAIGMLVLVLLYGFSKRRQIRELFGHIAEPLSHPLNHNPSYEGAYGALAACDSTYTARFGLTWVWLPAGLLVVGVLFAISDSYFVIDSFLARFDVGYGTGVLFGVDLVISLVAFAVGARRLGTWRLALSVHKSATTGYPEG